RTPRARGWRRTRRRPGRAARGSRRACPARERRRTASARIPGRAPPLRLGDPREVELGEGLLDEPALVGRVERLASDLLRGHDRQVGDLAAEVVECALGRGLDVAFGAVLRLRERLLALLFGLLFVDLGRLAGARHDLRSE